MRDDVANAELPTPPPSSAAATLAAVTVTYNPDIAILSRQLQELPPAALKVWVDNASPAPVLAKLRAIAAGRSDLLLLENPVNTGLAAALNQGAAAAGAAGFECRYLLLLDQDTETGIGGAEALLSAYLQLEQAHARLGCVGPKLVDVQTGLEHGFHQISGWRWVRRYGKQQESLPVSNLNGSGTLLRSQLFQELDGLDAGLFIDHVDTEWAFRVLAAGYELLGVPGIEFKHRMGNRTIRFWAFGWRAWPYRSPMRHYFLFRNTVRLLLSSGIPVVWTIWAPVKLLITLVAHSLFDADRAAQFKQMNRGLRAGFVNRGARLGMSSMGSRASQHLF